MEDNFISLAKCAAVVGTIFNAKFAKAQVFKEAAIQEATPEQWGIAMAGLVGAAIVVCGGWAAWNMVESYLYRPVATSSPALSA